MATTIDEFTVVATDRDDDESEWFRCEKHSGKLLKRLQKRVDLCDVELIAGDGSGKRISAHRLILIESSDYFDALLNGTMRESQQREITLNDVDGDALESLINFCYTGSLKWRVDTIEALLATANYLQFDEVFEPGCEFLLRHLRPSNCLDVGFFAQNLNHKELMYKAERIMCENFAEISEDPKSMLLNVEMLSRLLVNDDLDVPSEVFVFHFVMQWIEFDAEVRWSHFATLLAGIRLPLLLPKFLAETVEPLCDTVESQNLVLDAFKTHLLPASRKLSIEHRRGIGNLLLLIYGRQYQQVDLVVIEGYSMHGQTWTKWSTPIEHRRDFATVLMDENLVMIGGRNPQQLPLDTVTSLDLRTMALTRLPSLRVRRSDCAAVLLNGSIYVIGGFDGCRATNSVERWDPVTGAWNYVASMTYARYSAAVALCNGYLYACGGRCKNDSAKDLTSVECYDPVEDVWMPAAPLTVPRAQHCLVSHKGLLYAVGGLRRGMPTADLIECYDVYTDTWTKISCVPKLKPGLTRCASLDSNLFFYNGANFYKLVNNIIVDDILLERIPKPRSCSGNYVSPEILCVAGVTPPDGIFNSC